MARYVAGECYAYTERQTTVIRDALNSVLNAYQPLTFSNAVKKIELGGDIDAIQSEMQNYIKSLENAVFTPTNF